MSPNPIHYHIEGELANMSFPASWAEEGVVRASERCIDYARLFLCGLGDRFGLIPYKVVFSKEQGIYAAYRNAANRNVLRVEIDEDLDVVANVSDGERVLASGILDNEVAEKRLISVFDPRLARAA